MHGRTLLLGLALAVPSGTLASPLLFDLRAPAVETLDGGPTLSLTVSDITATVSADQGVLNRTASGFGVNAPGGGDDTDTIDGALVDEAVSVAFDSDVLLDGILLSSLTRADTGVLRLPGRTVPLSTSGFVSTGEALLLAGAAFRIAHVAGNGFSFDGFVASPRPVATVPSPSTLPLSAAGLAMLLVTGAAPGRKRRPTVRAGTPEARRMDSLRT